jgi:hypothetical protein
MEIQKKETLPNISLSISLHPLSTLSYGASNLLGDINALLVRYFYSRQTAKKVYVTLCELIFNVVDNIQFPKSRLKVELKLSAEKTVVKVKNKVNKHQYDIVKAHIDTIKEAGDPIQLFSKTISEKRKHSLTGGLGLLRLFIENSPLITTTYNNKTSYMTIETKLDTRSLLC